MKPFGRSSFLWGVGLWDNSYIHRLASVNDALI
jgi:hypothetical protein